MSKTLLFIYNSHSGMGLIRTSLSSIIDMFSKEGYEIIIHSTQRAHDAVEKVEEYKDKIDAIACAGGDGTVNEIINSMMEAKIDVPLFYLPSGSANDFGSSLRISKQQIKAARSEIYGSIKKVDIGRFNERYFCYVAAFGLLTDISYATDQNLKNRLGYAAYLIEGSKRLMNIPVIDMTVVADGRRYTDSWFYGMITNSTQVGGVKNITGPNVLMDDGLFELTLVRATKNPIEFIEVINSLASGSNCRFLVRDKAAKIEIYSKEPVSWTIDGEAGGKHTDVVIENIQRALSIAVPREACKLLNAVDE